MEATKTTKGYIEAVGRRKTAIARVRITPAAKMSMTVNDKDVEAYFPTATMRNAAMEAFKISGVADKFKVTVKVLGGGIAAQAEAIRHALSRTLTKHDMELRKPLKAAGFMKRDPRAKERRKFGLKKARKSPQWSKR